MSETRGVFSLEDVVEQKGDGDYVALDQVWHFPFGPSPNAGFVAGGKAAGNATLSSMEKLDFTSDTSSEINYTSQLNAGRYFVGSAGNFHAGYHLGGFPQGGPSASSVDKTTYSTSTSHSLPSGLLTTARHKIAGSSSETTLYAVGGSPGNFSSVQKLTYSTETTALLPSSSNKGVSSNGYSATGNQTHGYFGGGLPAPNINRVDKFTYSSETFTNLPGASLTAGRYGSAATGNSTQGYFSGGGPAQQSSTDKVTYSTETEARAPGADLSQGRDLLKGTSSSTHGYMVGGMSPSVFYSIVDKLNYSDDTAGRVPGANLNTARRSHSAVSPREFAFPSGAVPAPSAARGIRFSDNVIQDLNIGHLAGGSSPAQNDRADKLDFTTDTINPIPSMVLPQGGRSHMGSHTSETASYFSGGGGPGNSYKNYTEKITYATDSPAAVPGGNMSQALKQMGAVSNTTAGYLAGGINPGLSPSTKSTVDKFTYSTETSAALPSGGDLSFQSNNNAGVGNADVGYLTGGSDGDRVERITYSSDTTAQVPGAALPENRNSHGASGNSTQGYLVGGLKPPASYLSTVDKLTYSTETTDRIPSADLPVGTRYLAGTGNRDTGYFAAGRAAPGTGQVSTINKMTYSSETSEALPHTFVHTTMQGMGATGLRVNALPLDLPPTATPTATTSVGSPISSTPNTGYYAAGNDSHVSIVDKITYSTDTTARVPSADLPEALNKIAAVGSQTAAYVGGGHGGEQSYMQKITYATDTSALTPNTGYLSVGRMGPTATGTSTAGYFGGGYKTFGPNAVTTVDKITYSSDTTAQVPGASLSDGRYSLAAAGNTTAGYFGGGRDNGNQEQSRMDKLTYSDETTAYAPGANLTASRQYLAATGSSTHGYFAGSLPATALMNKTTYSSDTTEAAPGANLNLANSYLAATSSTSAGYFSGGVSGGTVLSRVEKTTYSTDTTAYTPGANLPIANYSHAGASAKENALPETIPGPPIPPNTGYFAGGLGSPGTVSTMDKVDFSTDTNNVVPSAALSSPRYGGAAIGNRTAGYFGGGTPGPVSTMDKLIYSSDTTAVIPGSGANLSAERSLLAATGNADAGYFGGGGANPYFSTMDKITYSSDTTGAVPGAALSIPRGFHLGATGNPTAGYFGGGNAGPSYSGVVTTVDKVTYATDTTADVPSAALSVVKAGLSASGNLTHGYFSGGPSGSDSLTLIEKITFSADFTELVPGLNLAAPRTYHGATGNDIAGYHGSGNPAGPQISMDKINYSTDTSALIPSAAFTTGRRYIKGTSGRDNGIGSSPNII